MRTIASLVMAWWDVSLQYLISIGNNQGSKNMAQGEDHNKNREWDVYYEKQVVYYDALVNAWVQNRLDRNRQLLTISYLAVGLLIVLISSVKSDNLPDNLYFWVGMAVSWLCAFVSFILCGFFSLSIMNKNTVYLQAVANEEKNHEQLSLSINRKARVSFRLFLAGVVFICLLSLLVGGDLVYNKYREAQEMSGKNTVLSGEKGDPRPVNNDVSGVTAIKPAEPKSPPTETLHPTKKGEE